MTENRRAFATCHGPSMFPALGDGDVLGLEPSPCRGTVKPGDIIVFVHPAEPFDVAHRVVRVSAEGVVTRGDANDHDDPGVVPWAAIKGKVVDVVPARSLLASSTPRRDPLRYLKPGLLPLSAFPLAYLACMNGNEASGNACVSGPEASGGCKSGAAASTDCRDGAAAGFQCGTGTGN